MIPHAQTRQVNGKNSGIVRSWIFPSSPGREGLCRGLAGLVACLLLSAVPGVCGQASDQSPTATEVLTNVSQIWSVPRMHADEEYRIQTEVLIYFVDAEWGNASGECLGTPVWLP